MYTETHSQLGMFLPGGRGGGGVRWISSDRDDQRMFFCLNFSILGFFGGRKIWQEFFRVFFFSYSNLKLVVVPMLACHVVL